MSASASATAINMPTAPANFPATTATDIGAAVRRRRNVPDIGKPSGAAELRLALAFSTSVRAAAKLAETDQRKMSERRHRTPVDQFHAAVMRGPLFEPLKAESHPPAELASDRCKRPLIRGAKTFFGAEVIDQDDFAAGFGDAGEFIERGFRVRHRGDDI